MRKAMHLYARSISEEALVMMRRVHTNECSHRVIDINSFEGRDLQTVIMYAFRSGNTAEGDLAAFLRNLTDIVGSPSLV